MTRGTAVTKSTLKSRKRGASKKDFVANIVGHPTEEVAVADLKPHPKNYKVHPEGQFVHIAESLKQHGVYRNVVIARDGTLLAGHGVVEAAVKLGVKKIAVVRLDIDPDAPGALKVLAGDNELARFAEADDRALTELLKHIGKEDSIGLLGTGYDEKMLAALVMVTRPASEIMNMNEAAEWVGMPEYDEGGSQIKLVITFESEKERKRFIDKSRLKILKMVGATWSSRWPAVGIEDTSSVRFEAAP